MVIDTKPCSIEEKTIGNITRVGVDIAKSIFHVHAFDRFSEVQWKGKYSRGKWLAVTSKKVPIGAEIAMEAFGSASYWGRELGKLVYKVKIIHAQFVKPYFKNNKNDAADAQAFCEAMSRPNMRFVNLKTVRQQDVQAAHRIEDKLMMQRTAKADQIRGLTSEYGLVAAIGIKKRQGAIPVLLEDTENGLSLMFRALLNDLSADLAQLDERVLALDKLIEQDVQNDPVALKLMKLRGIGVLHASAL